MLDVEVANAFRVDPDGRWKESWYLPNDQAAWDRFFSERSSVAAHLPGVAIERVVEVL